MQLVDEAVQVRAAGVALAYPDVHEASADAARRRACAFVYSRADLIVVESFFEELKVRGGIEAL